METSTPYVSKSLSQSSRRRRFVFVALLILVGTGYVFFGQDHSPSAPAVNVVQGTQVSPSELAVKALGALDIKGRAPSNNYDRTLFGAGWASVQGCDMRNRILARDLENVEKRDDGCVVLSGTLNDPYTAKKIEFIRGDDTSVDVQIDHVVALSDAWQKGAASMSSERREEFANDPLNLLAVDGPTNIKKSNSDAASWLPPNKSYRCRYIARQIAVKAKYNLWITRAEHGAIERVLNTCLGQVLPVSILRADL